MYEVSLYQGKSFTIHFGLEYKYLNIMSIVMYIVITDNILDIIAASRNLKCLSINLILNKSRHYIETLYLVDIFDVKLLNNLQIKLMRIINNQQGSCKD